MKNGFTLIELLTVIAIAGILSLVLFSAIFGKNTSQESNMTFGVNGIAEVRCINGYKFVVGSSGSAQQVLNGNGGGVTCESTEMSGR